MLHKFSRTELLLGGANMEKLKNSHVLIAGIGGVGSYVVEALARCNVGKFTLVDDDLICLTNINRQVHATSKTVGQSKVDVMKERILSINSAAEIITIQEFLTPENMETIISADLNYIVDAIDTVTAKLALIERANSIGAPIVSCMGTGNKLHPEMLELTDIYKTTICPLARVMRKELKKRGVPSLTVCYSKEEPLVPQENEDNACAGNCVCPKGTARTCTIRRQIPGSTSFVPSAAGMILAGHVIRELTDMR